MRLVKSNCIRLYFSAPVKITILSLIFFLIGQTCWSQGKTQKAVSLKEIYETYESAESHSRGVTLLKDVISQELIQWNATNKDSICYILKWYDRTGDPYEFEEIIYKLLDYNTMQSIEECFRITNRLGAHVENAKSKWLTPKNIEISPDSFSIMVNDSKPLTVSVRNDRKIQLRWDDLVLEYKNSNDDLGYFSASDRRFYARGKNGELYLNISVKGYENCSHSVKINIYGEKEPPPPPPHPAPIISKIEPLSLLPGADFTITGENFCSTNDSNDVFIGENYRVPPVKVSSTQIKLKLPNYIPPGKYSVTVETEYGTDKFDDSITIVMLRPCPSQKWPRISSGAFLLAGTIYIVSSISATNKWNDYADDPNHSVELYDDYKSAHKIKQISGIATLATGVCSAVLWYYYIKDKKKCASFSEKVAFFPDSELNGIRLVYSF